MDNINSSLGQILTRERDALKKLLCVLKNEKDALVENNIEDIKRLTEEKNSLKLDVEAIEKERLAVCGNESLSESINKASQEDIEELTRIGEELRELVSDIESSNKLNRSLLTQSLNYTRMVMNSISPKNVTVYSQKGEVETGTSNSNVLNRSI